MSQALIRRLFEGRLKTWAAGRSTPLEVAWQNAPMDAHEATYLRAFLLPAPTESLDLAGSHRLRLGIFQVSIVSRPRQGTGEAEGIAVELEALYPNNLRLTSGAFAVQIVTPVSIAGALNEPDSYVVPVSFTYRSDTA